MHQIGESPGALGNGQVRVIHLRGRIPEDVKFKIIRRPAMGLCKGGQARGHDVLGVGKGDAGVLRIAARPQFGADLIARDFSGRPDDMVIPAALQHGQRGPTIHRQGVGGQEQDDEQDSHSSSRLRRLHIQPL